MQFEVWYPMYEADGATGAMFPPALVIKVRDITGPDVISPATCGGSGGIQLLMASVEIYYLSNLTAVIPS